MSTTAAPATEIYSPGLEGVIAGESAVSTVTGGLRYRGYPIGELVDHCSFEEVAHLLLHGELPTAAQLREFNQRVSAARPLSPLVQDTLERLPKQGNPMDAIRTAVSLMALEDPDVNDNGTPANLRKSERLLGNIPTAVAAFYRLGKGQTPIAPRPDLSLAANFLFMLNGQAPTAAVARAFEVSLILYAEHEFNASTFTARVICSTLSDLHSSIVGAIGALKGALHGGANERVMDVLQAIGTPEKVDAYLKEAFARKDRIMGFGHRVYKHGDVRAGILKKYALELAGPTGNLKWEQMADRIETVMAEQKNMFPNLDWPAGRLYHAMQLETPVYTPIFVMSRVTGWSAHVIEQLANNRLIRPRSRYTGPEVRAVVALAQRG